MHPYCESRSLLVRNATVNEMHSQKNRALRVLWGIDDPPVRGPKARFSAQDVALSGIELADEGGLAAVSLGRVADRLGLATTGVYRYVDSKEVLIEVMIEVAVGDPPVLDAGTWQERCREWVRQLRRRYERHPWMSEVQPAGFPRQPRAYAWIEALVMAVEMVPGLDGVRLALLLDSLVRSYAALARSVGDAAPEPWLAEAVADRFPALSQSLVPETADAAAELDFAVEVVLRGVTQIADVPSP